MEPLTVLREFASSGRLAQVSLSADTRTVKFGDQFEFGADAPTRWRAKGAAGANAAAPLTATTLPLGALAFFATSPTFFDEAPWGDYLKNARAAGLATVPVVDRKVREGRKEKEGGEIRFGRSQLFPFFASSFFLTSFAFFKKTRSRSPTSSWASTTARTTSSPRPRQQQRR